jgi:hypothetical protein
MDDLAYRICLHCYPQRIALLPNPQLVRDATYSPSANMESAIRGMWSNRNPRVIGSVSERVVFELIDGGTMALDGKPWMLTCKQLRQLSIDRSLFWEPEYGIRCDDLAILGIDGDGRELLFLAESKGTTRTNGLSRDEEAKMFYQLARTFVKIRQAGVGIGIPRLGGIVSAIVDHLARVITMNVNDDTTSMAGELPDR